MTPPEIAAICYADVFDYPLTQEELKKFEISCHSGHRAGIYSLEDDFKKKNDLYFLKGREQLVDLRKKRDTWSRGKFIIAEKVAYYLRHIPTIQMVAVTGALAMNNCDKDDDVDLLVVTKSGTIWTTRFLSIILLELLGKRRRPNEKNTSNKICLNMFVDEDHLAVPEKERDLFSAHEVAQVKIVWGREETISKFWESNRWINDFLPNIKYQKSKVQKSIFQFPISNFIFRLVENVLEHTQLWYMKKKRTSEIIKAGYLRFHPNDARTWVLMEYKKRLRKVRLE